MIRKLALGTKPDATQPDIHTALEQAAKQYRCGFLWERLGARWTRIANYDECGNVWCGTTQEVPATAASLPLYGEQWTADQLSAFPRTTPLVINLIGEHA